MEATFVAIHKKMIIISWVLDASMVFQGFIWICGSCLVAPINIFAFQCCCFGVRDVEDSDFHAILVIYILRLAGVMCFAGSKALSHETVNSPTVRGWVMLGL